MSDLGDLLELMFTAHARVASVRATLHEWVNTALWQESSRRWAAMDALGSRSLMAANSRDVEPATLDHVHHVWHDPKGGRWRIDFDGAFGRSLVVLDGDDRWWGSDGQGGYTTNVGSDGAIASEVGRGVPSRFIELVFDPASLLASTTLVPVGRTEIAGRPAVEATAHWRKGIDLVHIDWPYADELRLAIDWECGVLLKFETMLDGEPFIRWEAGEIAFNEALPDDTFAPLPGARLPEMQRNMPSPEDLQRLLDEFRAMGDEEADESEEA